MTYILNHNPNRKYFFVSFFCLFVIISSRSVMSDERSYPTSPNHPQDVGGAGSDGKDTGPNQTQSLDRAYRPPVSTSASNRQHSLGRVQQHPQPSDSSINGPWPTAAKDYRYRSLSLPLPMVVGAVALQQVLGSIMQSGAFFVEFMFSSCLHGLHPCTLVFSQSIPMQSGSLEIPTLSFVCLCMCAGVYIHPVCVAP